MVARTPTRGLALILAACLLPATPAAAAQTGAVTGAVKAEQATLRRDGPKDDLDVVVWLEPVDGEAPPAGDARSEMDQRGLVFIPHVLAVQTGTTVTFLNNDNDQHNVYFLEDRSGQTLDIGTWGPGVSVDHTFTRPGPVITLCKLHLEMAAYVVVVDTPWFRTVRLDPSDLDAEYRVDGLPPGEYVLHAWHKKLRQKGGEVQVTVPAGGTARADVVVTPARYAD